jgi:glycosyltransferase involved in cell wall biosynthesis
MVGADTARAMEQFANGWASRATGWVYPRLDGAVCHAQGQARIVAGVGLPPERARVIPHGINVERVRALASEPPPDWLPLDQPFVVSVGRLSAEKRYDALISAHAEVLDRGVAHRLVILGDGDERAALEALSARLGVRGSVLMPGFFHNPFPVVAQASLFCLPSEYEGWSLVLTEALALGIPAIATDTVGGPSQILGDGEYGELIDDFSVAALAESITRHLREPEILQAKASAGREHAASFSAEARAERYADLFREVLGR